MPVILRTTSTAATSTTANVFTGSVFEYARRRSILSLGVTGEDPGLFVNLNVGADVVAEEFIVPQATVYPIIPDDFYFQDIAEQGDRLVLTVRNSTGGAEITRAIAILTEA